MAEHHKVEAELHLDDHASHTLEHVKEGFEHLGEKTHEVQHEMTGFLKNAASMALGIELAGMVETMKSIGEEVFAAAAGMEEQEKAIRGVMLMTDDAGTSLEEMGKQAHELNEQFAGMSVETGASKDALVSAFTEMAERTGMASEDVAKLTGSMAQAGRAVPGGVDALSTGFANMAAGIIRARNPIVQLIAATGMLKGNAKQVAEQMKKMSPEQAMNLGIAAIEKMGTKMKGVPLSFNETIASMKALREQIFEAMGSPLLAALGGPLNQIRDYFIQNKEAVAKWAEEVGHDAGEWLKEAFQYLQDHGEEIKAALQEGGRYIKDAAITLAEVVHFMWDHREAIALAYGASKVAGLGGAIGVGGIPLLAGVAAVGAGAAMGDQAAKLAHETIGTGGRDYQDEQAREAAAHQAALAGDIDATKRFTDAMLVAHPELQAVADQMMATARAGEVLNRKADALTEAFNGQVLPKDVAGLTGKNIEDSAGRLAHAFAKAEATGSTATQNYLAHFAVANENIWDAMNEAGPAYESVALKFIESIEKFNPEMGKSLRVRYANEHGTGTRVSDEHVSAPPVQNFYGAIHIQQDFKNMDPDRMIIAFRKVLQRSAQSKTMAATQTPHTAF
jgi:hypothetical protein